MRLNTRLYYKQKFRFIALLISLLFVILALPAMAHDDVIVVLVSATYSISLFLTVFVLADSMKLFLFGILLALPNWIISWTDIVIINNLVTVNIQLFSQFAVDCFVIAFLLNYIFQTNHVTMNIIYASVCIYLLLGFAWSIAYTSIELNSPGSFAGISAIKNADNIDQALVYYLPKLLYFSYITITTLGFGNVYPLTNLGNALASIEAIVGQLYITLLIGRLLGMHIAEHHSHHNQE